MPQCVLQSQCSSEFHRKLDTNNTSLQFCNVYHLDPRDSSIFIPPVLPDLPIGALQEHNTRLEKVPARKPALVIGLYETVALLHYCFILRVSTPLL